MKAFLENLHLLLSNQSVLFNHLCFLICTNLFCVHLVSTFPFFQKLKRFPSETETDHEPSRGIIQADHRCDYCQQSPLCNRKGVFEALLFCKDCTAKGKLI